VAGCLEFFDSCQATPRNAVIQGITPDHVRGRVSSFQSMLTQGMPALGQTGMGGFASMVGPVGALLGGAVACAAIVTGIVSARSELRGRDLGDQVAPSPSSAGSG
jgi:hypothetical protein